MIRLSAQTRQTCRLPSCVISDPQLAKGIPECRGYAFGTRSQSDEIQKAPGELERVAARGVAPVVVFSSPARALRALDRKSALKGALTEIAPHCSVLVIKRSALAARAARDNQLATRLWTLTAGEVQCLQGHMLLLIKSANERVAAFILELAERTEDHRAVELPMSHQDIADNLGLTIETVCLMTLTHLVKEAAIELPSSRRIVLRSRSALGQLTGSATI